MPDDRSFSEDVLQIAQQQAAIVQYMRQALEAAVNGGADPAVLAAVWEDGADRIRECLSRPEVLASQLHHDSSSGPDPRELFASLAGIAEANLDLARVFRAMPLPHQPPPGDAPQAR